MNMKNNMDTKNESEQYRDELTFIVEYLDTLQSIAHSYLRLNRAGMNITIGDTCIHHDFKPISVDRLRNIKAHADSILDELTHGCAKVNHETLNK